MCNLCRYMNTIDLKQLAKSNPFDEEDEAPRPCTQRVRFALPDDEECDIKPAPPVNEAPLQQPSVESFLLDSMLSVLNSDDELSPIERELPHDYPTFQISTVPMADGFSSVPYEMNRTSPSLPSSDSLSSGPYEAIKNTSSQLSLASSDRFASIGKLKKRGHKRSNAVLSASSPSRKSSRDSLDGLFTPSPLSAFNQRDDEEDYFGYKKCMFPGMKCTLQSCPRHSFLYQQR